MASQPAQPPILCRVDTAGRLVTADPPLQLLQEQSGGRLGGQFGVPQLAALARLAARLGVAITRPVVAATETEDLHLIVRAEPDPDGVTLSVERWTAQAPARPRWSGQGNATTIGEDERAAAEDVVTDSALRVVKVSPALARRLGQSEAELIGQPLARIFRPVEDAEGNLQLVEALAARAELTALPARIRPGDASVLLDGVARTEGERFLGYVIQVRSGTGTEASGGVPMPPLDDLLTEPLSSIIGQAQEIAGRSQGPLKTDYAGYGADIATAAQHLLGLLKALGGDAEGALPTASGEPVDLAELVLDAAGLVQAQATARRVVLDIGGEGSLPARGQPRAVTQILVNLIGNAVRFSPEGGVVTITLERGARAQVTVSDMGPGVAPADRLRIFERFEQGEAAEGHAGLGLAISRRLARDMDGEVALLDSPAGASFRLTLPTA